VKNPAFVKKCSLIRVLVTDVDGVLTDGGIYYGESGAEMKKFNIRDGVGCALLKIAGIQVGIMTSEKSLIAVHRARKIGVDFVVYGAKNKLRSFRDYMKKKNLKPENVAYIGDEINDAVLLGKVGLFFTVQDGCKRILELADVVLRVNGGEGALKTCAEIILQTLGAYEKTYSRYVKNQTENQIESYALEELR